VGNEAKAKRLQWLIAAVFFILGGWCLVAPGSVMELTVREPYRIDHPLVLVSLGAFGAQAVLAGLSMRARSWIARLERRSTATTR
jgi:hypothetical protein